MGGLNSSGGRSFGERLTPKGFETPYDLALAHLPDAISDPRSFYRGPNSEMDVISYELFKK